MNRFSVDYWITVLGGEASRVCIYSGCARDAFWGVVPGGFGVRFGVGDWVPVAARGIGLNGGSVGGGLSRSSSLSLSPSPWIGLVIGKPRCAPFRRPPVLLGVAAKMGVLKSGFVV